MVSATSCVNDGWLTHPWEWVNTVHNITALLCLIQASLREFPQQNIPKTENISAADCKSLSVCVTLYILLTNRKTRVETLPTLAEVNNNTRMHDV